MKTHLFARSFWVGGLAVAALFPLVLHGYWAHAYAKLPARVDPPSWGKSYVAIYDFTESPFNVDSYLFNNGLFGFHRRIASADLVLFGSSHVLYGLSAARLSSRLSAEEGHPVKVFNAALVGTSQALVEKLVESNELHDKQAIFDLFAMAPDATNQPPPSRPGFFFFHNLAAYVAVCKCWTDFWHDWLLDALLPRLRIAAAFRSGRIAHFERFLRWTTIRDWNTGDAVSLWTDKGPIYPESASFPSQPINNSVHLYSDSPNAGVGARVPAAVLASQDIRAIYTLLPFDGSDRGAVPGDAQPYIPLSPDGLLYWDGSHLNGAGRDAATEKLFEGIEKQGIAIGPAPK